MEQLERKVFWAGLLEFRNDCSARSYKILIAGFDDCLQTKTE